MVCSRHPSSQTQPYDYPKLTKAHSNALSCILKRLTAFEGVWGAPEVDIRGLIPHVVYPTMDVTSCPISTFAGPQAPENAYKRVNIHDRVLLHTSVSVWLTTWLCLAAWMLAMSVFGKRSYCERGRGHIFGFPKAYGPLQTLKEPGFG